MIDDNKHDEKLVVRFTEREYLDISRLAAQADKRASEYVRFVVRLSMYGSVGIGRRDSKETNSTESTRGGE